MVQLYKARTLLSSFKPGVLFDDIKICNNLEVYRKSNPTITHNHNSETEYLKSNKTENSKPLISLQPSNSLFMVYPNPTNGQFSISLPNNLNGQFKLFDAVGKQVFSKSINGATQVQTISVFGLCSGVYTYEFLNTLGTKYNGKITIE